MGEMKNGWVREADKNRWVKYREGVPVMMFWWEAPVPLMPLFPEVLDDTTTDSGAATD